MLDDIKQYLDLTRGMGNYSEVNDDDIQDLCGKYKSTLNNHNIDVVIIKSKIAKTELVDFCDKRHIVWDTSFFDNVSKYINSILHIKNILSASNGLSYQNQKEKCQTDMSTIWNDLFASQIAQVVCSNSKQRVILEDYLASGRKSNAITCDNILVANCLYFAKHYIFSHELAHVTYIKDQAYLNKLFEITKDILQKTPESFAHYELVKDKYEALINNPNYSVLPLYHEIIADSRAVQTVWTKLIQEFFGYEKIVFSDEELTSFFPWILKAQDGIDLVRSYLVHSTNLRHLIHLLVSKEPDDGVYTDFLIRDCFSNPINLLLLCGFDNNTGRGKMYLSLFEEYRVKRNIGIIDDLFSDEFCYNISNLQSQLSQI